MKKRTLSVSATGVALLALTVLAAPNPSNAASIMVADDSTTTLGQNDVLFFTGATADYPDMNVNFWVDGSNLFGGQNVVGAGSTLSAASNKLEDVTATWFDQDDNVLSTQTMSAETGFTQLLAFTTFSEENPLQRFSVSWTGNDSAATATAQIAASPIPLPAGLPLLISAIGGLAWFRGRQRTAVA